MTVAGETGRRIRLDAALLVAEAAADDRIAMRFVRAGKTMPVRGFAQGVFFTREALQEGVARGLFDGAAVFFQHVDGGRDVRDLAGVTAGATYDEETDAVVGMVHLYGNGAGRELQALAKDFRRHRREGIPHPDIGVSIDSYFVFERGGGLRGSGGPHDSGGPHGRAGVPRALRMKELLSVDVVFRPAADGRILARARRDLAGQVGEEGARQAGVKAHVQSRRHAGLPRSYKQGKGGNEMESIEGLDVGLEGIGSAGADDGRSTMDDGPDPAHPQPVVAAAVVSAAQNGEQWLSALRREAVSVRLAGSGLPQVVRDRLAAGNYDSPEQLDQAVQAARDELAALAAEEVIQIGGQPPRGRNGHSISGMHNGVDRIQGAWEWVFGVQGAEYPEPQLRDVRSLYHLMTGDYEFRGTYNADRVQLSGATTGTLADVAANAMNKVIMAQFSILTHWRWYERVAYPTANDGSVQDMQWTAIGGLANLPQVPEKGAYDELTMGDVKETDAFVKYGGYVPITLELIRNSNIQRLQAVPRALALAAVRTRSAKVAEIFTSNSGAGPTLDQDSTALFHNDHSNLQTTAFGTDATAWRAARAECFNQAEVHSGKKLALFPRYWLGPADLYDTALSVFGYGEGMPATYTPEAQSRGFADPRPIPLAVPDFTDATDWAYIVDPQVFPVIHISYAQAPGGGAHPAPELFTVTSPSAGLVFSNDVLPIKVRDWFAVGVNGYRGIGKRNVA